MLIMMVKVMIIITVSVEAVRSSSVHATPSKDSVCESEP